MKNILTFRGFKNEEITDTQVELLLKSNLIKRCDACSKSIKANIFHSLNTIKARTMLKLQIPDHRESIPEALFDLKQLAKSSNPQDRILGEIGLASFNSLMTTMIELVEKSERPEDINEAVLRYFSYMTLKLVPLLGISIPDLFTFSEFCQREFSRFIAKQADQVNTAVIKTLVESAFNISEQHTKH